MGRKDSAGNQAGTARMTVGDRFWARRIRPIFDDGDLTLEQKSVFCCIVARDPMSVAIECPARDIAAAEAGLPRRDYDEALAALERGGYIVDIVTPLRRGPGRGALHGPDTRRGRAGGGAVP